MCPFKIVNGSDQSEIELLIESRDQLNRRFLWSANESVHVADQRCNYRYAEYLIHASGRDVASAVNVRAERDICRGL